MKLLLVEDEQDLAMFLAKGFRKKNYAVDHAYNGEEALWMFETNTYDAIILDVNLPKIDGFEVLKEIRKVTIELPVLILSARTAIQDRIEGLDLGSNDYVAKPFDFQELEARIRALLRRKFIQQDPKIAIGPIMIDTITKKINLLDTEIKLTPKEYAIIEYLASHKNAAISAEELMEHVWDSNVDLFTNPLKYHIHSIKKKMINAGLKTPLIENIRGQGYRICETLGELHE